MNTEKLSTKNETEALNKHNVMRCASKVMIAAAFLSMIILAFVLIIHVLIYDEKEAARWMTIWMMSTLLALFAGFAAAIAGWFKEVREFITDVMRCA